jgi:osmotically-inducible protein OsmY
MRALKWLIPSVLLAGCLAACSTTPPRSPAERQADATLGAAVEAALEADPQLFARHIDVSVDRGKVFLGGYVWSSEDFYRAPLIARSVPGVTKVVSNMELLRGGRSGGR